MPQRLVVLDVRCGSRQTRPAMPEATHESEHRLRPLQAFALLFRSRVRQLCTKVRSMPSCVECRAWEI